MTTSSDHTEPPVRAHQRTAALRAQFGDLSPPEPDQCRQDWLDGLAQRLRRALLAHPDGARAVSASQLSRTMADISEQAISTLVAHGIPVREARVIVLTVERFPVGHVLAEQAPARTRTR
ncbi:hypothetical protein CS0771_54240 [Catellatospora sp. IY07-71]|uniref:TetR/AcrR family transcriptional regulator C-terminal domain-containing protein n=1 Tax=Catellatospora sp. IY07-71 TaxID=2728827 RepID=UPI001BB351E2|nr:TetR/AcrR family transcriptional regulator C-terminal domain-containing protein [Catellatospora sp. IY07-71]BCJ75880.1 hypothetical protein CS0771_54240 [Catellatospora sp. IY07-71]